MNKNLFRIIFNKRRGQLMAVAETSSSQGKGSKGETTASIHSAKTDNATVALSALSFAILCALGAVLWALPTPNVYAQVVAYRQAPSNQQPTILQAANGVPQVNIQTPSAAGVSHNIYSQFDVQSNGVILNNSRVSVQTQQGGWIQGNPWLATGSARVILNEVNSSNPSYLNGYVEVAGQRAEVVIANPSGISVNGGGFINTSKATLTTGTPIVNGGSLDGYRVQGGSISINGKGLDLSTTDYAAILARAVQVNAGVWANELKVVTGANQIDASSLEANTAPVTTTIAGTGAVPTFALDVAQIGGMYAGKIHLIGTEQGLGVRSAGILSATGGSTGGDLVLQNNGWLTTTGALQASANLQITTQGNVTNSGTLYASNDQTLIATGSVTNSGVIAAQGNTSIMADSLSSSSVSVVGAGIKTDGSLISNASATSGNLNIATTQSLAANGRNLAAGNLTLTGGSLDLSGSQTSATNLAITTAGNLSTAQARVVATQGLNVSSADFNNAGGTLAAAQAANLQTGALNNDGGLIQIGGDLTINTHGRTLTNTNAANYTSSAAALTGKGGIASQGTTILTTGDINNDAGYIGSKDALSATSANISNTQNGHIQGLDSVTLAVGTGAINNTGGLVRSGATTSLSAGTVTNSNTLSTTNADLGIEGKSVTLSATTLGNSSGAIRATNKLSVASAGTVNNNAGLMSAGDTLSVQDSQAASSRTLAITNTAGTLIADKTLTVAASSLEGDGKVLSKGDLSLTLNTDFSNSGQVIANGNATLTTSANVSNSGKLQAGDTLKLTANNIENTATGEIFGNTNQVNTTSTLTNRGLIDGVDTQINAATVNNIGTGRIYGDHLSIAAANLTNDTETLAGVTKAATIAARDRLDLGISGTLTNREHALIYSVGDMAIGGGLDAATRRATGSTTTVNNNSATIEAGGNLNLSSATLNNTNDHFAYEERVTSTQTNVREDEGSNYYRVFVRTTYDPVITSTDPGKIFSGQEMTLQVTTSLNNQLSQIIAGGVLNVPGVSVNNTSIESLHRVEDIGTSYTYKKVGESCGWYRYRYQCDDIFDWQQNNYGPISVNTTVIVSKASSLYNTSPGSTPYTVTAAAAGSVNALTSSPSNSTVRTSGVNGADGVPMPSGSLYKTRPSLVASYLVETDARFTNNKLWLGSDYMTQSLSLDPTVTQKRLGDGFYEQKLIREQVAQLTGRRFLADYTSDEQEYQALMNSGITFAKQYNLRPGIALTAQQIAQLTSDVVWLVEQTVTLPDGSSQKVLVPQVYVKVQPGDLDGSGALLAGKEVNINLSGNLINSGTIAGRNVVNLTAENVNNLGGRIDGSDVSVAAKQDLNNIGASISAVNSLSATAGRDLTIETTTRSATSNAGASSASRTTLDRVAGLYVSGQGGTLVASAGRDLNIVAGVVSNAGSGTTSLGASNNVNISTVKTASSDRDVWDADNFRLSNRSQDVGSTVQGGGGINISAGQTVSTTAANVQALGALNVNAKNVEVKAGQASADLDMASKVSGGGFFGGATSISRDTTTGTTALGSNLGGATVNLNASNDIAIQGSNVISDNGTTLSAGGNVSVEAATNTSTSSSYAQKTQSGFSISSIGGNPIGVSYSKTKQSDGNQSTGTTAAASTLGSVGGNVTITAGNQYKQVGSDVLSPTGDINITAKRVDIQEARETSRQSTEQKFEQTSISVSLKGGIIDNVEATTQAVEAAKKSSSTRNQNLNALIAFGKGSDAYEQGKATQDAYNKNGVMGSTDADGKAQPGASAASGIKVSVSIGSSSSQSNSTTTSNTSAGSTVKAGGNVNIKATGQGEGEGNLTVQGSNVSAAKDVSLSATQDVNILASADTESNRSSNKSSSTSVGVSVGIGSGGAGLSLDIAASRGKGQANSDSTTYNNSHVSAGNSVNITSGGDTNVIGGTVKANQVTANVGGNLNLESLQDTATSQASQKTTGIALSIPIYGTGGSASFSQGKQNSDSNYASVNEQSGIKAGEGGFAMNVGGNTDLKGATVTGSSDASKNTLTTNTLITSDISNSMSASASSSGVSVGTNMMDGKYAMAKAVAGNALNNGNANQSDASKTTSAISAGSITVGGKTTDTSKEQLKDSNGKTVSTDTSTTNRTLAKADVSSLETSAKAQQADNMLAFTALTLVTTDLVNKQQTADKKIMLQKCDANGQNCGPAQLVAASDVKVINGKAYVFNNGIMNDEKQALENAAKQSSPEANQQGVYVIINPHTGNPVAEVLSAAWDKLNEITKAALPISNAAEANLDVREQVKVQGGKVVEVDHSRGTLTGSVATSEQVNRGVTDAAIGSVTMNGGAANSQRMADQVNTATSGTGVVQQATHKDDTVGTFVGGNAATGGQDASMLDAHTTYTGSLPSPTSPSITGKEKENDLKVKTDKAWGERQYSKPVVVSPSK
jgi:filamentous hemagglutinin